MSELIKHECGVAMIRLLKPLSYYQEKYGTPLYGINQLNVMMQKQKNRGQDGAGIATIKLDMPPGSRYVSRKRSIDKEPIDSIFKNVYKYYKDLDEEQLHDADWVKKNVPYSGELLRAFEIWYTW